MVDELIHQIRSYEDPRYFIENNCKYMDKKTKHIKSIEFDDSALKNNEAYKKVLRSSMFLNAKFGYRFTTVDGHTAVYMGEGIENTHLLAVEPHKLPNGTNIQGVVYYDKYGYCPGFPELDIKSKYTPEFSQKQLDKYADCFSYSLNKKGVQTTAIDAFKSGFRTAALTLR